MTSDINNPLILHCLLFTIALKGMEPVLTRNNGEGAKKLEGGSFKFVTSEPTHEGK